MIETTSLCPVCYKEIPAKIGQDKNVWMIKNCEEHGRFEAMVERDPKWFNMCRDLGSNGIYDGFFIDATSQCNIKCKYCFHDNTGKHRPKEDIIKDATDNPTLVPFVLTGGEPTTHPDLLEILKAISGVGETVLLSNGVNLCDEGYLDEVCSTGVSIGLSFHPESNGKDFELLDLCRKKGYFVGTTLSVIDDVKQIDNALDIYREYKDVIGDIRIKAATNIWAEKEAHNKLFVSDMINYINHINRKPVELDTSRNNKVSFGNLIYDGMTIMPVSWYDTQNVDLEDINCAPWYRANDGNLYNLVTACLKNEHIH